MLYLFNSTVAKAVTPIFLVVKAVTPIFSVVIPAMIINSVAKYTSLNNGTNFQNMPHAIYGITIKPVPK